MRDYIAAYKNFRFIAGFLSALINLGLLLTTRLWKIWSCLEY